MYFPSPVTARAAFVLLGIASGVLAGAGCSASRSQRALQELTEAENLTKIERAFDRAFQQQEQPPADAEQLKPFLRQFGDPEVLLRSPHDGEPYVIYWGVNFRKASFESPATIIAHEKRGVNGKRYVLTVMGVRSMTDEEFAGASFIKPR